MGKFWMDDDFIRIHANQLSLKSIAVYTALNSYSNKEGKTFVGHRRIGSVLGINKDSVTRAMRELEASDLVRRSKGKNGQPSETTILPVRIDAVIPSETVRPKEVFKESIKEENIPVKNWIYGSILGRLDKVRVVSSVMSIN